RTYLPVAVHAGFLGSDAGKIAILERSVAVAAVNAHAAHVVLMAEGRVLHPRLVLPGHILRALQLGQHRAQRHQHKKQTQDRHPRQRIGTAMKKLRHRANGSLAVERAARSPARPNCGYKTGLLDLSIRTKPTIALKNSELYQQASIRRQRRSERTTNLTRDGADSRGFIAIVIPSAFR